MKVSIDEIRRQYAALSDEGLLEIEREDLMEQARQCYDEELERRHIRRPRSAPEHFEKRPEDLVIAARYPTAEEGNLARDLVIAAGISAVLDNDPSGFQLL